RGTRGTPPPDSGRPPYERAPALSSGGAAVLLFSNGTAVLHDLGVTLDGVGARIDRQDALTADGRLRIRMDYAHTAARYGFECRAVPRRDLVARLADGLPAGLVRYGMECRSVTQDAGRVTVTFADGSTDGADVLIGADGRHSAVRRCLWGEG